MLKSYQMIRCIIFNASLGEDMSYREGLVFYSHIITRYLCQLARQVQFPSLFYFKDVSIPTMH